MFVRIVLILITTVAVGQSSEILVIFFSKILLVLMLKILLFLPTEKHLFQSHTLQNKSRLLSKTDMQSGVHFKES